MPLALFSLEAYFGMVIGYFAANFLSPRVQSLTFNVGAYKIHLHHWCWALTVLPAFLAYKFIPLPIYLTSGFLGGIVFQGIFCYSDWHKIIVKKPKRNA